MKKLLRVVLAAMMTMALGFSLVACGSSQETKDAMGRYNFSQIKVGTTTVTAEDFDAEGTPSTDFYLELGADDKFIIATPTLGNSEGEYQVADGKVTFTSDFFDGSVVAPLVDGTIAITYEDIVVTYAK